MLDRHARCAMFGADLVYAFARSSTLGAFICAGAVLTFACSADAWQSAFAPSIRSASPRRCDSPVACGSGADIFFGSRTHAQPGSHRLAAGLCLRGERQCTSPAALAPFSLGRIVRSRAAGQLTMCAGNPLSFCAAKHTLSAPPLSLVQHSALDNCWNLGHVGKIMKRHAWSVGAEPIMVGDVVEYTVGGVCTVGVVEVTCLNSVLLVPAIQCPELTSCTVLSGGECGGGQCAAVGAARGHGRGNVFTFTIAMHARC